MVPLAKLFSIPHPAWGSEPGRNQVHLVFDCFLQSMLVMVQKGYFQSSSTVFPFIVQLLPWVCC